MSRATNLRVRRMRKSVLERIELFLVLVYYCGLFYQGGRAGIWENLGMI
jgi:hypothetical protein